MGNKQSKSMYGILAKIFFVLGILVAIFVLTTMFASEVPTGNNCGDNVAYLQKGVDSYKKAHGVYPTKLGQLLESKDGKGPFVETIDLQCPTENQPYIIVDGRIQQKSG